MGFWAKSVQIFKCFCENGKQSIRDVAHQTGFSKSSVHRLQQAMERRDLSPESWFWETEEGRTWLMRLVVATIYTFGFKRGVGAETMSEYFVRLHLQEQIGCSPNALRSVMKKLETLIVETAKTWESEASANGEVRDIIGAVDETFLEYMMLVFMDLHRGYILLEEVAADRTYTTWKALVDDRLTTLKSRILSLVSDRAKALIQLAEKGFGCLSVPDFFTSCMSWSRVMRSPLADGASQPKRRLRKLRRWSPKPRVVAQGTPRTPWPSVKSRLVGRR